MPTAEVEMTSCATVLSMTPPEIELSVYQDLRRVRDELRTGDAVSLAVKDEADGRLLFEQTEVIDAEAPYYVVFQFGTLAEP